MTCPFCAREVRDDLTTCPHCLSRLPTPALPAPPGGDASRGPASDPTPPAAPAGHAALRLEVRPPGDATLRRRVLAVVVAVSMLAIGTTAGAAVGIRRQNQHWARRYERAVGAEAFWRESTANWRAGATGWQRTSGDWQAKATDLQASLKDLQARISDAVGSLSHPHFVLWNACTVVGAGCALQPGSYYVGGVPDTFTYFVNFTSTTPVEVRIMSTDNFVCWASASCGARWISWSATTELHGVFHLAEGCAAYLAVFIPQGYGTLYPDVEVTRKPASHPTGACG